HAAARLTILLNRLNKILRDPDVADSQRVLFEWLVFANAGTRDRLPRLFSLPPRPRRGVEEVRRRHAPCGEIKNALAAKDLKTEASAGAVPRLVRREETLDAAVKAVGCRDAVAGNRPHALGAGLDVGLGDGSATFRDAGKAPARVAGQEAHQVHEMG